MVGIEARCVVRKDVLDLMGREHQNFRRKSTVLEGEYFLVGVIWHRAWGRRTRCYSRHIYLVWYNPETH